MISKFVEKSLKFQSIFTILNFRESIVMLPSSRHLSAISSLICSLSHQKLVYTLEVVFRVPTFLWLPLFEILFSPRTALCYRGDSIKWFPVPRYRLSYRWISRFPHRTPLVAWNDKFPQYFWPYHLKDHLELYSLRSRLTLQHHQSLPECSTA